MASRPKVLREEIADPSVEKDREPAVGQEREEAEVVAVLMATQPLAKRRIGWAHAARYHA